MTRWKLHNIIGWRFVVYVTDSAVKANTYACKLVAGNCKDAEVLELVLECIQCQVLWCRSSERRHVDQQYDVAAVQ